MGSTRRYLVLMMALMLAALVAGCTSSDTGGSHDSKNYERYVRYDFDCYNLSCYETSHQVDFNSDGHRARTCIWNCGTGYKQSIRAYVKIKFETVNGCWRMTHDEFSSDYQGVCN